MIPFIDSEVISRLQQRVANVTLSDDHVIHIIANQLLERLDYMCIQPVSVLNYGWHTNYAELQLKKRYPESTIKNIIDLTFLGKCADNSVDLIIANFSLLRERDPVYLLHEFSRVLKEEGLLLFTTLGPDTFVELRQSFLQVDRFHHVHPFSDMHDIGDWMKQLHFSDPVVDREEIILAYDQLDLFFQDLKEIGATNAHQFRQRGLMSKNKWKTMLSHYERYKNDDYFPVTLEIIYGQAWKVKWDRDTDGLEGEIAISLDSIMKR
ncbi:MAG: methyltransferase domain-containing protein [Gammaproteobacteria bacterium]|nr:methyltransferase domain-containing protein [Gammaproteobacteria bacterium]